MSSLRTHTLRVFQAQSSSLFTLCVLMSLIAEAELVKTAEFAHKMQQRSNLEAWSPSLNFSPTGLVSLTLRSGGELLACWQTGKFKLACAKSLAQRLRQQQQKKAAEGSLTSLNGISLFAAFECLVRSANRLAESGEIVGN